MEKAIKKMAQEVSPGNPWNLDTANPEDRKTIVTDWLIYNSKEYEKWQHNIDQGEEDLKERLERMEETIRRLEALGRKSEVIDPDWNPFPPGYNPDDDIEPPRD